KTGVIAVPLADVARIERTAPAPGGSPSPAGGAASGGGRTGAPAAVPATLGPPGSDLAADERRVEFLRRRIADKATVAGGDATLALDRREIVARLTALGEAALSARRYDDARRRTEEALTYDPSSVRVRRGLGAALIGLEQPLRARTVLE